MRPESPELTQARRNYIQTGTDETRDALEDARLRLGAAYTEYQDLLEVVEAVA